MELEVFGTFGVQILEVETQRKLVRNILGKCFATDLNIICQRDFSISMYFLTSEITVSGRFCQFKISFLKIAISRNFCYGGIMLFLLDQKCIILPDFIHCLI